MGVRITGGQWCGRVLQVPKGDGVRPTTGRVRESVLQKIAAYLPDAHVLDGFAGSGLMGLECLSRGAASLVSVEKSPQHAKLVQANMALLGVRPLQGRVVVQPLQRYLAQPLGAEYPAYTVVYLDPPYGFTGWPALLAQLKVHNHGQWPQVCLLEVAGKETPTLLAETTPVKEVWRYGDTQVWRL